MAGFVLGVIVALFVGMKLARHLDGARGARADYRKAKTGLPGARKLAASKTFGLVRFAAFLAVLLVAVVYGMANRGDS
jgi:hypothetical protein